MSNNRKVSINLEFAERIPYEDRIVDTHIFTVYKSFSIKEKDLIKIYKQILEDFRTLEKKYNIDQNDI